MGMFRAAAALWHVPLQGSYPNSNDVLCVLLASWALQGSFVRLSSGNWVVLCFLLLFLCSQGFIAIYLKPPSSSGWVLLQPIRCSSIFHLQHDQGTTSSSRRMHAIHGEASMVGNSFILFSSVSWAFSDQRGTWKLLETDSCVSEPQNSPVHGRAAVAWSQNYTKVMQVGLCHW